MAGSSAALALALSACGSGPQGKPTARSPDDGRGSYKVGKPYVIDGKTYYPGENWVYDEVGVASWYGPGFHGRPTASGELYDQHATSAAHPTLPLPSIVRVTNLDNGKQVVARVNDRGPFAHGRIIDLSKGAARQIGLDISGTAKVRVQLLTRESEVIKQVAIQGGGRDAQMAAIVNLDSGTSDATPPTMTAAVPADDRTVTVQQIPAPQGPTIAEQIAAREAAERAAQQQAAARPAPVAQPAAQPVPMPAPSQTSNAVLTQAAPAYAPPLSAASLGNAIYVQAGAFSQPENAERLRAQLASLGAAHVMQTWVSGRDFYRVRIGPMATLDAADQLRARVTAAGYGEARVVSE
ncbi:MAG: septal ring lytic transglycosylase RlpA family protein [Reyranellaceae bacterium]